MRNVRFQLAWAILHIVGAAMNVGSALYHIRQVVRK